MAVIRRERQLAKTLLMIDVLYMPGSMVRAILATI